MALQSVGIVGAGAWGTALAVTAHRAGRDVPIWAYEPETLADLAKNHRNETYLPGVSLDPAIRATDRLSEIADRDLSACSRRPPKHARTIVGELAPHLKRRPAARDLLERHRTEDRQAHLASRAETAPAAKIAVLSGPSFAAEIARGLPAAVTLATAEERSGATSRTSSAPPPSAAIGATTSLAPRSAAP